MKYCSHCGAQIDDKAVICIKCGCACTATPVESDKNETNQVLGTIAMILMIISCGTLLLSAICVPITMAISKTVVWYQILEMDQTGTVDLNQFNAVYTIVTIISFFLCLLPLAWRIPMTVSVSQKTRKQQPVSVGMKVCTLIFVNLIAGILLLCMNNKEETNEILR